MCINSGKRGRVWGGGFFFEEVLRVFKGRRCVCSLFVVVFWWVLGFGFLGVVALVLVFRGIIGSCFVVGIFFVR